MINGVELIVYSASGVYLGEVRTFMQLRQMVERFPEKVFDAGDKKARVDGGGFCFEFDSTIQFQNICKTWNGYMNYPTSDRSKENSHMSSQADLHMHSTASDGTDTPSQLAEKVKTANIRIFAITDHDTVMGAEQLKDYPSDGLIFIHGIEFSCRMDSGKCHILGYGCDASHPEFRAVIEKGAALRRAKLERRLVLLRERGIHIPDEELKQLRKIQSVGKPHLANLMVRLGYARDRKDAIENIINPCRTESSRIQAETAVRAIAVAGGIPVWAHPLGGEGEKDNSPEQFAIMLDELIRYGLLGIECFYSKYPLNRCEELAQAAQSRGLLISGGSDYHGTNKSIALGTLNADGAAISLERLTILRALGEREKFT